MSVEARRACVIGWPVRHSRSPMIHGYWLRTLGLQGSYIHAEVPPERIGEFVGGMRDSGFVGGNVTLPHKEAAFALCARPSETARALRAANTLWYEDGELWGDNTDVAGFLANLDETVPDWDREVGTAVVLGAGGAARAVLHALGSRGVERCVLVNRTLARAEDMARDFPGIRVLARSFKEFPEEGREAGLVVNTTSLGMVGQPPLDLDLAGLPARAVVADIVYVPLETALLSAAKVRGLRTAGGLGMLLHQAVPGFEHWFGVRPKVTPELRALVVADIERKA